MSWGYLTSLLDELQNHATFLGKLWLTAFLVFRIVLTAVGGDSIYHDEHNNFVCNTYTPGCHNVCYNLFAPLSHVRFWVFQIILVATPLILYLGYAVNKIARTQKKNLARIQQQQAWEAAGYGQEQYPMSYEAAAVDQNAEWMKGWGGGNEGYYALYDERQRIKHNGLMCMYVFQLLARSLLEVCFLWGQYILYGFNVPAVYRCATDPCPNIVHCYISRPTEKTIFLLIMYAVALLCLALNIFELLYLGTGAVRDICRSRRKHGTFNKNELNRQYYSTYPYLLNAQSAQPDYNIGPEDQPPSPNPIPILTNSKMECQQNHVTVAQNECQHCCNNNENKDFGQQQNTLEVEKQADNQQPSHDKNDSKPEGERRHGRASKHTSSKVDGVTGPKYGELKDLEWL